MTQDIVPYDPHPVADPRRARRLDAIPERLLYTTRAGLGALPSGLGTILVFLSPQAFALFFLFWAIWWPYPATPQTLAFAWVCSAVLVALAVLVGWLLARRYPGFALAILRAPFTRIAVTDRRVVWSVPWSPTPLMEIGRHRILGALLGPVDRRGRGNAAMVLVDGDPAADVDGNIHFDRLPHAARFVAAIEG